MAGAAAAAAERRAEHPHRPHRRRRLRRSPDTFGGEVRTPTPRRASSRWA
ncbi:MAG: hypothetical protein M0C28_11890 [Candidatus Moduliflexus flocculans]|nr:hypothetical protein [Candidatus Moduliflexus flocculans]